MFLDPLYNNSYFIDFGWKKKNNWWRFSSIFPCSSLFPFSSKLVIVALPFQSLYLSVYSTCHHVFIVHHQPWPAFLNCSFLPLPPTLCLSPSAKVFVNSQFKPFLIHCTKQKPWHSPHYNFIEFIIKRQDIFTYFIYSKFWFCYFQYCQTNVV